MELEAALHRLTRIPFDAADELIWRHRKADGKFDERIDARGACTTLQQPNLGAMERCTPGQFFLREPRAPATAAEILAETPRNLDRIVAHPTASCRSPDESARSTITQAPKANRNSSH